LEGKKPDLQAYFQAFQHAAGPGEMEKILSSLRKFLISFAALHFDESFWRWV
jgi:hypothetical protein